jgi:hypothetical protein
MLSDSDLLRAATLATARIAPDFWSGHVFYALRLAGALVLATVAPILIDRRARRSPRVEP